MKHTLANLAVAIGLALTSLFATVPQAQAAQIQGDILMIGRVTVDAPSLLTATQVTNWFAAVTQNVGFSTVAATTGDFTIVPLGTEAAMATPWVFANPTLSLWSVGPFTFDLLSATIVTQTGDFLNILGTGTIHGAGFDDTVGEFRFTATGTGTRFGFAALTSAVPDGGSTVMLLGLGLSGIGLIRRYLVS